MSNILADPPICGALDVTLQQKVGHHSKSTKNLSMLLLSRSGMFTFILLVVLFLEFSLSPFVLALSTYYSPIFTKYITIQTDANGRNTNIVYFPQL